MLKVMSLQLSKFQFLQLSLFFFSCMMALALYGTRNDGELRKWQLAYLYSFYLSWFVNLCLEAVNVLKGRREAAEDSSSVERRRTDSMWGFTRSNRFSTFVGWPPGTEGGVGLMIAPRDERGGAAFEMKKLDLVRQKEEEEKKHELGITAKDMASWRIGEFATRSHSGRDFISRSKKDGMGSNFLKSQFKKMTRKKKRGNAKDRQDGKASQSVSDTSSSRRSSAFMGGKVDIGNVTGMGGNGGGFDFSPGFL